MIEHECERIIEEEKRMITVWDRHDNDNFYDNDNITDIDNNNINVNDNDHRLRSEDRWRVKADMLLFPIVQWDFRIIHLKVWIS